MSLLEQFSLFMINNIYLAVPVAFLAGVVSSFSPCILTTLPLVAGYMGNSGVKDRKRGLLYSLVFTLGISITFIGIGLVTAYMGRRFSVYGRYIYILLSFIMIGSALNILGVLSFGKKDNFCEIEEKPRRGGLKGIFTLGLFGGFVSSPCATPVLAAILSFVASRGNIALGALMLMAYSIGHSIPVIIAGVSISSINRLLTEPKYIKIGTYLRATLAMFVLVGGFYVFYLGV